MRIDGSASSRRFLGWHRLAFAVALSVATFACLGPEAIVQDEVRQDLIGSDFGDAGQEGDIVAAGSLWTDAPYLPDCCWLAGQGTAPVVGVNCSERHLDSWLGSAKRLFFGAAIVQIGVVGEFTRYDYSVPAMDYQFTLGPTTLSDSSVKENLFGDVGGSSRLACTGYATEGLGVPQCISSRGEAWNVYPGEALAFVGEDCFLELADPNYRPIYRLFPISAGKVFDFDGKAFELDVIRGLITSAEASTEPHPEFGYASCVDGLQLDPSP